MNLLELSKLPPKSYRVIDGAKGRNEPLRWFNSVTIIKGLVSVSVWRKTAYSFGLCDGSRDNLPPQLQRSELRENPGRKSANKINVTIQVSKEVLVEFGGLRKLQKRLIVFITSKI